MQTTYWVTERRSIPSPRSGLVQELVDLTFSHILWSELSSVATNSFHATNGIRIFPSLLQYPHHAQGHVSITHRAENSYNMPEALFLNVSSRLSGEELK